ncbi:MAG TPA: thiamine-phosphate kinase [Stellaceae bacterium]|nr:thiamine-phosphate kinase [Stellaceae bacterium]
MAAPSRLSEFERIARFFAPLAAPGALGLMDDVALIDGPPGAQYVLKTDAIVEGVHFRPDDPPKQVGQKLLRVNLSDLAAKGATPVGYLLMTALAPSRDEAWLAEFAAGLAADQATFGIGLLGGDSVATPGATTLSVAAIGRVAAGRAVLRRGARPGDRIYVSGTLGDAALGLKAAAGGLAGIDAAARAFLIDRYRLPQPRLALGLALVGTARAMIDISDGLVADLGHICEVSGVGAVVEVALLPLSHAAKASLAGEPALLASVLGGGDDYELLFTAPPATEATLAELGARLGVAVTVIGRIEAGQGVRVLDPEGHPVAVPVAGYQHF